MKKRVLPLVFLSLTVIALVIAFIEKENINVFISKQMQKQTNLQTKENVAKYIDSEYNYIKNKKDFEFTLLEFGSGTCIPCKQMEPVLESIKRWKNIKVNVQFIHIMKTENQEMMKFYGISAVPIQILLDKNGVEFFKHYGFISEKDLLEKFQEKLNS